MLHEKILIEGLYEMSSKEFQEEYWLSGDDPSKMSSFDEAVCYIFDDAGLTRAVETGYLAENFSKEVCLKVTKLDKMIKLVPDDAPTEDIIEHPKMEKVRRLSRELYFLMKKEL